jgi:CheY-like chemotaxis protein
VPVGKRILVIEDDESIRDAFEELLSGEGYFVTVAGNGSLGLAALAEVKPSLVLLDLMMPVMDGRAFLQALEKNPDPELAATPVVLITAAGDKSTLGCKVSEVLSKPIDIDKLLAAAARHCRASAATA